MSYAEVLRPRGRLLSFTFDDGLKHGADVACEILAAHRLNATFYVVTGWVQPIRAAVKEPWNVGRSHGDWAFWRKVRDAGHEVGSHTFSHVNMGGKKALLMPWIVRRELEESQRDLVREVPQARYTISMPWNVATPRSERHVHSLYSACRLGGSTISYNRLDRLEPRRLQSWAPGPDVTLDAYERVIDAMPNDGWLILQFHSFDTEGWAPLSQDTFTGLCRIVSGVPGLDVLTVSEAVSRYVPSPAQASARSEARKQKRDEHA